MLGLRKNVGSICNSSSMLVMDVYLLHITANAVLMNTRTLITAGEAVKLVASSTGEIFEGELHAPPLPYFSLVGKSERPVAVYSDHFGVHTVRLANGKLFRTEGRVYPL